MSTEAEDLKKLIEKIETIVPYVTATIDPRGGNTFHSEKRSEWIEVHGGRAGSSTNQLEHLLKLAREMKKDRGL